MRQLGAKNGEPKKEEKKAKTIRKSEERYQKQRMEMKAKKDAETLEKQIIAERWKTMTPAQIREDAILVKKAKADKIEKEQKENEAMK